MRFPQNHFYDTSDLEYKLYLAEKEENLQEIDKIKKQIEEEIKNWDLAYETNNEGWSTVNEFKELTSNLMEKIFENPEFGSKIFVPTVQQFSWGDYFSIKEKKDKYDYRIVEDLNTLLFQLECIEKQGINYVGFVGE